MTNTFELKKGKIVFDEEKLTITDNGKSQKNSKLFSAVIFLFLAGINIYSYQKNVRWQELLTGSLFALGTLFMLISYSRMSAASEILLNEIKAIKVQRIFFREYLIIRLKDNKIRRVAEIFNPERLEEYIKTISLPN